MYILRLLALRFYAFLHPVADWRGRIAQANEGNTVWPAPVEGKSKLSGFPLQWILAEPDASAPSGLRYPEQMTCLGCRTSIRDVALGVRCARCGIPLHERCAGMRKAFDVPMCGWCGCFFHESP